MRHDEHFKPADAILAASLVLWSLQLAVMAVWG